jgi:hypothetical protein
MLKKVELAVAGGGVMLPKQIENLHGKNALVYSLIVGLRGV